MTYGDNPAARVAWFMKQLYPHRGSGASAAGTCAVILGLDWPTDLPGVLTRLGKVAEQTAQVRTIASSLPNDAAADLLLQHFDQVERVVSNFATINSLQLAGLLHPMQDTGWHSLDLAANLLHRYAGEPVLGEDTVTSLRRQTRDLIDQVIAAEDLEPDIKRWLLTKLRDIENALHTVALEGLSGIERALDSTLGGIARVPGRLARLGDSKTMAGVVALMTALNLAVGTATGTLALTTPSSPSSTQVQVIVEQLTSGAAPSGESDRSPSQP